MGHPFFDAPNFPWSYEPEAGAFYGALCQAINDVDEINNLYKTIDEKRLPLTLKLAADKVWVEALENLTVKGLLRDFCYKLLDNETYKNNTTVQDATKAVIEAQGREESANHSPMQREKGERAVVSSKSPWWRPKRVGLVWLATGLVAVALISVGGLWGVQRLTNWRRAAPLPAARVAEPNDKAVREKLSANEQRLIEDNVDSNSKTTVLIVSVGEWSAAAQVNVRIKPAEYDQEMTTVYERSAALLKHGNQTTNYPATWDPTDGSLSVSAVNGMVGDQLYILVVLPITKNSEPLLSDSRTMKRFLFVEVSR
jgi:hypothetical protein